MPVAHTAEEEQRNIDEICASRQFPGVVGVFSDRGVALNEERMYREHNITHRHVKGTVAAAPNSPSMQCQCGNCASHRKRAPRTKTADVGKDV